MKSGKTNVSYADLSNSRRCYNFIAFKFVLKYFIRQIQAKRGEGGVKLIGIYLLLVYAVPDDDFLVQTQQL